MGKIIEIILAYIKREKHVIKGAPVSIVILSLIFGSLGGYVVFYIEEKAYSNQINSLNLRINEKAGIIESKDATIERLKTYPPIHSEITSSEFTATDVVPCHGLHIDSMETFNNGGDGADFEGEPPCDIGKLKSYNNQGVGVVFDSKSLTK